MAKKQNTALLAVGKGITNVGGGLWSGWSGQVIVNNNTVEMFNFVSPRALIVTNFQYYINHGGGSPSSAEYVGWDLSIDGIDIIISHWKATSTQHFNDMDQNSFIIPANSTCKIESYTNASVNIPTYAVMTLKETES